jgi:hypothetical protein
MIKLKRNECIKNVSGYEGLYAVTTLGRVWSYRRKKWLKPFPNSKGYLRVSLLYQGEESNPMLHRLVAEAFIPNIDGKPQVNHINGKKRDNRASNLEWCTARENMQHASDMGLSGHKLSYEDKVIICQNYHSLAISKTKLAVMFSVTVPAICYIIKTYSPILGLA